ncbi:MAG: glycosyltransferase [Thermoguttaceae bacterium]
MEAFWWTLYWIGAGVAFVQSLLLVLQTWEHRRYVRSSMRGWDRHQPTGRVLLCAPCKGRDLDLEDNLRSLLEQDYDDYEVSFIVESVDDPACTAIRRAMAAHPWMSARLIVAGRATESGQKVHNLLAATARLSPRIEYVAFVDSDARPRPEWLRMLISRLYRPHIGAMTGYRWFVPERNSAPNKLLYSLNCNVMSLLGRNSHYLLWGGSWAVRREVFEKIGFRSAWKGTIGDDLIARRLLSEAKMQVRFEPACVVASPIDSSFSEAISFVRRQYQLSFYYARDWWAFAVLSTTFNNLVWLGNLGLLAWGFLSRANWAWIPAAVTSLLYLLTVYRGKMRQDLADLYFPHLHRVLRQAKRFDIWFQPVISLIHGIIVWSAGFGRHVSWRGISYRLTGDGKIKGAWRSNDSAVLPMPGVAADLTESQRKNAEYQKIG